MWNDLSTLVSSVLNWATELWSFMTNTPLLSVVIALFVFRMVFDIFVYIKKKFNL